MQFPKVTSAKTYFSTPEIAAAATVARRNLHDHIRDFWALVKDDLYCVMTFEYILKFRSLVEIPEI